MKQSWGEALRSSRTLVMGILNVTPDSFSDGGQFHDCNAAVARALRLVEEGADIIDVGGESTRPGAQPVSIDVELKRTVPVIEQLKLRCNVPLSIDTSKPEVMEAAVAAGAVVINDVNALQAAGAIEVASRLDADICLMHRQGTPDTMQKAPCYDDVVVEVLEYLQCRVRACETAGIERSRLLIDPGFGFGKTVEHNLQLLRGLGQFVATGLPVLAGLSRKSMLQTVTGRAVGERLAGSVALATLAAQAGARVVRVHDVAQTVDAMKIVEAIRDSSTDNR